MKSPGLQMDCVRNLKLDELMPFRFITERNNLPVTLRGYPGDWRIEIRQRGVQGLGREDSDLKNVSTYLKR